MASGAKKIGNTFVWILLAMLIVGLAGFGATNFSGTIRSIGSVGTVTISADEYARALQGQIRALQQQTGERFSIAQMQSFGLDRVALERLLQSAALESDVAELGLSIGDAELQREILSIPEFRGLDGKFDAGTYRFTLEQNGMTETGFEKNLRAGAARDIVQSAVSTGVTMPPAMVDAIVEYVGARRSFTWALIEASALPMPPATATETELRAAYDANPDAYMLPETRKLTYAWLTPDMVIDSIDVTEEQLTQLYDSRQADYDLPERRLVERLVFSDTDAARDALGKINSGDTTFEQLVTDRGLSIADVDLGDVTADDVDATVFAAQQGDVVGPIDSDLGPALFHVGGILQARVTPLDAVRDELRDELARANAGRQLERMAGDIDDLLAGGATLEELPAETEMQTSTMDWSAQSEDGIAAYDGFRQLAATITADDYPEVGFLEDGGLFAMRLDDVVAPRAEPFETARVKVAADVAAQRLADALSAHANDVITQLAVTGDFATAGLQTHVENGLTRSAYIDAAPEGFMQQVFAMDTGDMAVIAANGVVAIARLDAVQDPEVNDELTQMRTALAGQLDDSLSQDLFNAYAAAAFMRADRQIDQRAVDAVNLSFQ
jgi:peptidyl-prolyl cis-trans isomerase D